jgi:hypothetical protein
MSLVLLAGLAFGEQLLGGLGLALQPGQARLLVHPCDLLTRRQPLAHDCEGLAVAATFWASTQLRSGSRLARISAGVICGKGAAVLTADASVRLRLADLQAGDADQHREQPLDLGEAGNLSLHPQGRSLRAASGRPPARQRHDGRRGTGLTVHIGWIRPMVGGRLFGGVSCLDTGPVLPATGGARNILDAVKGPGRTQC